MSSTSLPVLVVLGATGNQGGSVISHFLNQAPATHRLRGLTRNTSSASAQALTAKGVEMVAADVDDLSSLQSAFEGANAIFAVTDFWGPYNDPKNVNKGKENGMLRNKWAYYNELQQGKNILKAASEVPTLQRLIYSSLADTSAISKGKYPHVYHFDAKAHAIKFARTEYPDLMAKTSLFVIGGFLSNWLSFPAMIPQKDLQTGKYIFMNAFPEGFKMGLVAAEEDSGPFVEALLKVPAGKNLFAYRTMMSIEDFAAMWSEVLGKEIEVKDMSSMPQPEGMDEETMAFMQEFAETGMFSVEFGYAGEKVDKTVTTPDQLEVQVQLPTVKEWIQKQDWSSVF